MCAVVLCVFSSDESGARSWILDHVARLASKGEASLKFAGAATVQDGPTAAAIAIEFASVKRANAILSEWRRDETLPAGIETRVFRIETPRNVDLAGAMFP